MNSLAVQRGRAFSIDCDSPPRRVKSALNLTTLVLHECEEENSNNTSITNKPSTSTTDILVTTSSSIVTTSIV